MYHRNRHQQPVRRFGDFARQPERDREQHCGERVVPLLHHYPVSTEPEEMWEHGNVMLGFDAEERMIQKLPQDFAGKVVWGSRYPHHDATTPWDALIRLRAANVPEPLIARMMGDNAARQLATEQRREPEA